MKSTIRAMLLAATMSAPVLQLVRAIVLTAFLAAISACTQVPVAPEPLPTKEQLVGLYSWGDGMGANETLELHKDGTYRQTLLPHLDDRSVDLYGLWKPEGKYVFFYTKDGVYNAPGARLTYAEVFFHEGKPAFARVQDVERGLVHQWWIYRWQRPL